MAAAVTSTLLRAPSASAAEPNWSVDQAVAHADQVVHIWQPTQTTVKGQVTGATGSVSNSGGSVSLTATDARDSVVRIRHDGVQALTVLRHAAAPTFDLAIPKKVKLEPLGVGGAYKAVLRSSGKIVGLLDAPYAVDANGKQLSTHYTVSAHRITQHVNTTGAAFPVVADPYFRWYWNGVVVTLDLYDMAFVLQWGTSALIPMLVASGVGLPEIVGVLGMASYASWAVATHHCAWFWLVYWGWGSNWGWYSC